MTKALKLMCVLAHPDDESLGTGGTLAKYRAEGVETYLVTATRGQRGWRGVPDPDPGPEAFGRHREAELRAAAAELGVRGLTLLDYMDGDLDQADPARIVGQIAAEVRRVRPQVVITFGPDGAYGHPDHIAICQFTTAALVLAADPAAPVPAAAHRVSKLYYMLETRELIQLYNEIFPELVICVDDVDRRWPGWDEWAISAQIDCEAHWQTACRAIRCHASQLVGFEGFEQKLEQHHSLLVGRQTYYRAYSLVNGGRRRETDLFEGIRDRAGGPAG
jgi:LmbE family N-acetylglucosaminyl deacetylase